jgi:putative endonuclease
MPYYVYVLANQGSALYTGVTNDLARRLEEHRSGKRKGFTKRYRIARLIYYEEFKYVNDALEAEKHLKGLTRAKKLAIIRAVNPTFRDIGEDLGLSNY